MNTHCAYICGLPSRPFWNIFPEKPTKGLCFRTTPTEQLLIVISTEQLLIVISTERLLIVISTERSEWRNLPP